MSFTLAEEFNITEHPTYFVPKLQTVPKLTVGYTPTKAMFKRPHVKSAKDSAHIFRTNWDENQIGFVEEFKLLFLTRKGQALCIWDVSKGGTSGTVMDPKVIFGAALKARASAIILCHNHPSGNVNPSEQDKVVTRRLIKAGDIIGCKVLDHLILIPHSGYFSFAEEGLID